MGRNANFVGLCWVAVVLVWSVSALSVKATKLRQPLPGRFLYVGLTALVAALLNGVIREAHFKRLVVPPAVRIGLLPDLIVLAGLAIAIWARIVLGGNWSSRVTLKEDHELVQRGPYRFVRHPIYSGLLLMILGTAVLVGQVGAFVALVISFLGFWIKSRQEETLLARELPGYSDYLTRTKALIPFLF